MSNSGDEATEPVASEDPYAVISETTDDDDFMKVWEEESDESFVELPKEDDGTMLISTLQGQFPNAVGLRYKSSSGGWRGVRITDGVLNPPHGGWGETKYFVTFQKIDANKKPVEKETKKEVVREEKEDKPKDEDTEEELLQDLFVLHLPRNATDDDLKDYFSKNCGEMALAEIKFDRATGKSRGFGFIRFKTSEAAKEALTGQHTLLGQMLEVRISKKKETPCQLFVGRLPEGSTREDLMEYFGSFGEVSDAYITTPFRGFGFITYASTDIARSILRVKHEIKGTRLNVAVAEPKEEKDARRRRNRMQERGGGRRVEERERGGREERRFDPRRARRDSPPRQHDMMDEFRNMLFEVMERRR